MVELKERSESYSTLKDLSSGEQEYDEKVPSRFTYLTRDKVKRSLKPEEQL